MRTPLEYRFSCALSQFSLVRCALSLATVWYLVSIAATQDLPTQAALSLTPDTSGTLLTISKRVDEVQLVFTVTNKKGHFIDELHLEDFALFDNDLPPEKVIHFQQRSQQPLQVVLLVDISSSVQSRFAFEQKAAITFLKNVLRPQLDAASVISFGSSVKQVQPMTGVIEKLKAAVQQLRPYGDTALYDALLFGSRSFNSQITSADARKGHDHFQ